MKLTKFAIKNITATEILDSRGSPTVEVTVTLGSGASGIASVPSGKSTGIHEAHELRDGDKKRYGGRGVLHAVRNAQGLIAKRVRGMDARKQEMIDGAMLSLDGTQNKSRLGANAILGVSLACARAAAAASGLPLYSHLRELSCLRVKTWRMPRLLINVINGGAHADWNADIQEFHIIPHGSVRESLRMAEETIEELARVIRLAGGELTTGDEGGFAPTVKNNEDALRMLAQAIKSAGYRSGHEMGMGMDVAASEFYDEPHYTLRRPKKKLTAKSLVSLLRSWTRKYPLEYIEDPVAEDDIEGWRLATRSLGAARDDRLVVGDDFFVTNVGRLAVGTSLGLANAVLIKPNQVGTLTETFATIREARKHGYGVVVSHRSGETADTFIADLAAAVGADYLKSGGLLHGERVVKYLRLMQIEREV